LEDDDDLIDGEIYISMDRIIDNANKFNCNLNTELKRIIIHGLLHLIGYDDSNEEEKKLMTNLENFYMSECSQPIII
jgi:rRNA maturation RNase YbeY